MNYIRKFDPSKYVGQFNDLDSGCMMKHSQLHQTELSCHGRSLQ